MLLLDEPCSGLDSMSARHTVDILRALAARGRTVIFTAHQPASEMFALFDLLLLLSRGRMTFFGTPEGALRHFSTAGFPCPKYTNPLDHVIDITSIDNREIELEADSRARVRTYVGVLLPLVLK